MCERERERERERENFIRKLDVSAKLVKHRAIAQATRMRALHEALRYVCLLSTAGI